MCVCEAKSGASAGRELRSWRFRQAFCFPTRWFQCLRQRWCFLELSVTVGNQTGIIAPGPAPSAVLAQNKTKPKKNLSTKQLCSLNWKWAKNNFCEKCQGFWVKKKKRGEGWFCCVVLFGCLSVVFLYCFLGVSINLPLEGRDDLLSLSTGAASSTQRTGSLAK